MVIYAQRVRQNMTALGVSFGMPVGNEAAWSPAAGHAGCAAAREQRLPITVVSGTTLPKSTTKPDAVLGVHPGPRTSTSPPV